MSEQSKELFKQLLIQKKESRRNKKINIKKNIVWIIPSAYKRQYKTIISNLIKIYSSITKSLFINLENWKKEANSIKNDQWNEEFEKINENEYEKIFENEKELLKENIQKIGLLTLLFNLRQSKKVINHQFGFDYFNYENWLHNTLDTFVSRNVGLIKGLTEEYQKKIKEIIISGVNNESLSVSDLKKQLVKINKQFEGYRSGLIARDQVGKLNGQVTKQRQQDIGIKTYFWITSRDERVRKSHRVLDRKLCRWDDPTVYSDDNGKTWKKRNSIGGYIGEPQQDFECRCNADPVFKEIIEEVNNE